MTSPDDHKIFDVAEEESNGKNLVKNTTTEYSCFYDVASTFVFGILRLLSSILVARTIDLALFILNTHDKYTAKDLDCKVLLELNKISQSTYDAFDYVGKIAYLTYATTLLDTFLYDTTLYLFLRYPSSLGANQQIPIELLLKSKNKDEAITEAAARRAKEISYKSYPERIKFFRDNYNIGNKINSSAIECVKKYTDLRNKVIHDQGLYRLRINEEDGVTSEQKACMLYPTKITEDDINIALSTYKEIAGNFMADIFCNILDSGNQAEVRELLNLFHIQAQCDPAPSKSEMKILPYTSEQE